MSITRNQHNETLAAIRAGLQDAEARLTASPGMNANVYLDHRHNITQGWLKLAELERDCKPTRTRDSLRNSLRIQIVGLVVAVKETGARGVRLDDFDRLLKQPGVALYAIDAELQCLVDEGLLLPFQSTPEGGFFPFPRVDGGVN